MYKPTTKSPSEGREAWKQWKEGEELHEDNMQDSTGGSV